MKITVFRILYISKCFIRIKLNNVNVTSNIDVKQKTLTRRNVKVNTMKITFKFKKLLFLLYFTFCKFHFHNLQRHTKNDSNMRLNVILFKCNRVEYWTIKVTKCDENVTNFFNFYYTEDCSQ